MKNKLISILAAFIVAVSIVPAFAVNTSQISLNLSDDFKIPEERTLQEELGLMRKYLLSGNTPESFVIKWDLNKDGVFDVLDYAAIKKLILGAI